MGVNKIISLFFVYLIRHAVDDEPNGIIIAAINHPRREL